MAKQFKIYEAKTRIARLAKTRVRIVRDESPQKPWEDMDMVFIELDCEVPSSVEDHLDAVAEFKFDDNDGETHTWYTTPDRLYRFYNHDRAAWTEENLNKIIDEERELLQLWDDGEMFAVVREEWSDAERKWTYADSLWRMYGAKNVLENLPDVAEDGDVICVDEDIGLYFELTEDTSEAA